MEAFISYRSPSYTQLKENNCKLLNGEICNKQTAPNCHFRGCSFRRASIFANRQDFNCNIVPPRAMLPHDVLLTPKDFFKFCPDLKHTIANHDTFIRFEINKNEQIDSFWTNIELDFWKIACANKKLPTMYYDIYLDEEEKTKANPIHFNSISKERIRLYNRIIVFIEPQPLSAESGWGRYANCFIQVCQNCNHIFLLSIKALKHLSKNNQEICCPYCQKGKYIYTFHNWGKFPITYNYSGEKNPYASISPDMMINLLLDNSKKAPHDHILICMNAESFPTGIPIIQMGGLFVDIFRNIVINGNIEMRVYNSETQSVNHYNL